jgi:hypothetical protein
LQPFLSVLSSSRRISHQGWLQLTVTRGNPEITNQRPLMNLALFFVVEGVWLSGSVARRYKAV